MWEKKWGRNAGSRQGTHHSRWIRSRGKGSEDTVRGALESAELKHALFGAKVVRVKGVVSEDAAAGGYAKGA